MTLTTSVLFAAVRETLFELLGEQTYLGARPGMMAARHTWGQTLVLHPHLHGLVTGGGLTPEGHWGAVRNGYLLPGRGGMAVFRGQLLDALRRTFIVGTSRCLWRCARSRFSTSSIASVIRRHTGMCG